MNSNTPFLGILMLDTNFPRIVGDAGNVNSYEYEARTQLVKGAGSLDIVKDGLPSEHLINEFIVAAKTLERNGAKAIVSTCGFLISVQHLIEDAVSIPVMVSALSLYPQLAREYKQSLVGVITASESSLGELALNSAGVVKENVRIVGMEDCEAFSNAILKNKEEQSQVLNEKQIEQVVVDKALNLLENNSSIGAFLLECGNLPPYARAIEDATLKPVYSILDAANQMMNKV